MRRLVRAATGDPGSADYTLAPGESFRLESVVATLTAATIAQTLVPTLRVTDPSGAIIAEINAPTVQA